MLFGEFYLNNVENWAVLRAAIKTNCKTTERAGMTGLESSLIMNITGSDLSVTQ